jgi:hypothetical protein
VNKLKPGDKVWVLCDVVEGAYRGHIECKNGPVHFRPLVSEVKPVEHEAIEQRTKREPTEAQKIAERTMKAIWEANDAINEPPVVKDSLTTDPNSPKILDSSSDPMREAFEAFMVKRYDPNREHLARNKDTQLYFDDETEMAWQAFQVGSKYQHSPLAPSPCMDGVDVNQFIEGVMDARGRTSDPINPSHYKQGGIECIEAIKAALGGGFTAYLWGNILKYTWRWPSKNGIEDLKKARWYLDRLIQEEEVK